MKFFEDNKNLIILILLIACVTLSGILTYSCPKEKTEEKETLEPQKAVEKVLNYLNKNLKGIATAELIGEVEEKEGLYNFKIKIKEEEFLAYLTKNGKLLFPQAIDLEKEIESKESPDEEKTTIGYFSVSKDDICKEEDKPIIYFFGASNCPYCLWEKPVIEKVIKKFERFVSFHNNMDARADMEIFSKYSQGGIPTLVLGCKYYREGSGQFLGEETEIKNLTALICKLTNNQPSKECEEVKDIIEQIED